MFCRVNLPTIGIEQDTEPKVPACRIFIPVVPERDNDLDGLSFDVFGRYGKILVQRQQIKLLPVDCYPVF